MPTISMFYGILILMYFYDNKKHARPHIHAEYGDHVASIAIDDGEILSGSLPAAIPVLPRTPVNARFL